MAILLDFNPTIISAVSVGDRNFGDALDEGMIRHLTLNMILSYKKQFAHKYGKLIICCDTGNAWRKDYFPYYKYSRKKSREESHLDWEMIFKSISNIQQELREYMPYHVISTPRCEADDIIAVLSEYISENEPIVTGLLEEPQNVLIISRDKDFKQLQKSKHIVQWNPMEKKWMREPDPEKFLIEHIVRGDSGDGVPNILSDDDSFVVKKRQKPVRETLVESIYAKGVPLEHKTNYDRNKQLIDLSCIPSNYKEEIITEYKNFKPKPKAKLLTYFMEKGLKNLYNSANDF